MIKKLVIVSLVIALAIFSAAAAYGGFSSLNFTGKNGGISIASNASGTDEQFTIQSQENFSFSQTARTGSPIESYTQRSFSGGGSMTGLSYVPGTDSVVGVVLEGEEGYLEQSTVEGNYRYLLAYAQGDDYYIQQYVVQDDDFDDLNDSQVGFNMVLGGEGKGQLETGSLGAYNSGGQISIQAGDSQIPVNGIAEGSGTLNILGYGTGYLSFGFDITYDDNIYNAEGEAESDGYLSWDAGFDESLKVIGGIVAYTEE